MSTLRRVCIHALASARARTSTHTPTPPPEDPAPLYLSPSERVVERDIETERERGRV